MKPTLHQWIAFHFSRILLAGLLASWAVISAQRVGETYTGTFEWYDPLFVLFNLGVLAWLAWDAGKETIQWQEFKKLLKAEPKVGDVIHVTDADTQQALGRAKLVDISPDGKLGLFAFTLPTDDRDLIEPKEYGCGVAQWQRIDDIKVTTIKQ